MSERNRKAIRAFVPYMFHGSFKLSPKTEGIIKNTIFLQKYWATIIATLLDRPPPESLDRDILYESFGFPYEMPDYNYNVWGPIYWEFLHTTAKECKKSVFLKRCLSILLLSFAYFIPCVNCQSHYLQHIKEVELSDKIKEDPEMGIFVLHNLVNKSLNKPQLSLDDYNAQYS